MRRRPEIRRCPDMTESLSTGSGGGGGGGGGRLG